MAGLGVVLGGLINFLLLAAMGVGKLFDLLGQLGDYISTGGLIEDMEALGGAILKGLADGIINSLGLPVQAIKDAGTSIIDGFKEVLDIHSPSGVFEELGQFTTQGFTDGIEAASGEVDKAVNTMVNIPGARGGGGAPTVHLTVQVDGAGADAETLARKLADLLPSQLASAFEQLAIEGGTA